MSKYRQDPSETLKDVIYMYYIIEGYEREEAIQEMRNLFNILSNPHPPVRNLTHIHDFMEITRWIVVFPVANNKSLRATLRGIQNIYCTYYGQHYGKGDLSTDNAYIISACPRI